MRCFSGEHLRARSTYLRLRLQLLLHLQLVHLPEELLEQLASFRADALFQLVHNFLGRKRAIKGTCRIDIPPDDTRQACRAKRSRERIYAMRSIRRSAFRKPNPPHS
jgi:hypothetical protein